MQLDHLWLTDFRNYATADLAFPAGLLAITGANGAGKTNLLEAIAYLAVLSSFRGVGNEALVRREMAQAVVRGQGQRAGRQLLIEAEIQANGRGRTTVNRQPLRRGSDLADALRVTVFSPDDLELVKAGPTGRRRYLDDTLASLHPRHDAARRDFERVLRQRNALLAQMGGRVTDETATTLAVWDTRLVETGEAVGRARADLVQRLEQAVAKAYTQLAGGGDIRLSYDAPWLADGLAAALSRHRRDELRRSVSLVGPHRDELTLTIAGMPARTHASQGEQRSLALALRLGSHGLVTEQVGDPPLLLLDDVFSELDPARSAFLVEHLPAGQAVLTTTGHLPAGVVPEQVVRVTQGRLDRASGGQSHQSRVDLEQAPPP
ncbi:MAG: DNA replication/repair protein RecF [Acidimicrobiales bacterium]